MRIINLRPDDAELIEQVARVLVAGFADIAPEAWPDLASALEEVHEQFAEDRISRVAVDEQGNALGWIAGQPDYHGNIWELHPLVVSVQHQGKGIGRALVQDFEELVRARGAFSIWLGSDDEVGLTSLYGADLYTNTWEQIANIRNYGNHPYSFYQKLGYSIVGVVPDANGIGKPDIHMAKPVR